MQFHKAIVAGSYSGAESVNPCQPWRGFKCPKEMCIRKWLNIKLERYWLSKEALLLNITYLYCFIFFLSIILHRNLSGLSSVGCNLYLFLSIINIHCWYLSLSLHFRSTGKENSCYDDDMYHADCLHFSLED